MKGLLFSVLLLITLSNQAQDYNWWNNVHHWDGITPWPKYITLSPGYLGPNGLPVPFVENAVLPEKANLEMAFDSHFSKGDKTQNIFTSFYTPLFTKKVGLKVSIVPVEYYRMDTVTRDIRGSRDEDGKGFASGDFYVTTLIQLVKDKPGWPDLLATVNLKTASGGKLSAARNTDSPGYYFELAAGKTFKTGKSLITSLRPFGMAGFYSWQTNSEVYYQDDAILYGAGCTVGMKDIDIKSTFGGYQGYIGFADRPVVASLFVETHRTSGVNFSFMYRHGIRHYLYDTFRISCIIDLNRVSRFMTE
jgi:hypothetical protein